jgi:hypothetical protein
MAVKPSGFSGQSEPLTVTKIRHNRRGLMEASKGDAVGQAAGAVHCGVEIPTIGQPRGPVRSSIIRNGGADIGRPRWLNPSQQLYDRFWAGSAADYAA